MLTQIVEHTCGHTLARHAAGHYTPSADDDRRITVCLSCGGALDDDYLRDARGHRVKRDDDETAR